MGWRNMCYRNFKLLETLESMKYYLKNSKIMCGVYILFHFIFCHLKSTENILQQKLKTKYKCHLLETCSNI